MSNEVKINYQSICQDILLKDLSERTREVISRRFGLDTERETLESIGKSYQITRERVRQIEEDGLEKIEKKICDSQCQNVIQYFISQLNDSGLLRREDILLNQLGGIKFQNYALFLLTIAKPFQRFSETKDLYSLWTIDKNSLNAAKRAIDFFTIELKRNNQPMDLPLDILPSYIEIAKHILKGPGGLYGLRDWPEINPRGTKDKAYIVLKKEKTPLHFTKVASLINAEKAFSSPRAVLAQTVHNELIKDSKFVLVGRGLYALREWGYVPGTVREVVVEVLKKEAKPMEKDEVIKKTLEQRQVQPNTILLNLQNKKYFIKNDEGKYTIRKA